MIPKDENEIPWCQTRDSDGLDRSHHRSVLFALSVLSVLLVDVVFTCGSCCGSFGAHKNSYPTMYRAAPYITGTRIATTAETS